MTTGGLTVGTDAVPLNLPEAPTEALRLAVDPANTGTVYYGFNANLTAGSGASTDGYPILLAYEAIPESHFWFRVGKPGHLTVHLRATTAGNKVYWCLQ
jgi:hypothetical protein